jgi:mannose-6-phosphate isomerase-like protein (cupin superfamily)
MNGRSTSRRSRTVSPAAAAATRSSTSRLGWRWRSTASSRRSPTASSPHADDELYVVLEGRGTLEIEGKQVPLKEGDAVFVPAGAEHRFVGYESRSVLVIFARPHRRRSRRCGKAATGSEAAADGAPCTRRHTRTRLKREWSMSANPPTSVPPAAHTEVSSAANARRTPAPRPDRWRRRRCARGGAHLARSGRGKGRA